MTYCDDDDVYQAVGIAKEVIQRVTEKTASEVKTMVDDFISQAEQDVKDALQIPHVCALEKHLGTGEDDEFQLGPEDSDFYIDLNVENCAEIVRACYFNGTRKKLPYPRNCDVFTNDKNLWDATGYTQPSDEATIIQAGTRSMKFDWSAAVGIGRYPNVSGGYYIDKNIDIYGYMFLRVRSNTANRIITIRLYDENGNYNEASYTIVKANKWYIVMLDLDEDFTTTVDWDDNPLYWLTITANDKCILYVDNMNFNDGWCFTAPSGKLVIMRKSTDEPPAYGEEFIVTYTYDPFKVTVPENIKNATSLFAGVKVIDHLIGVRQAMLVHEAETLLPIPDKESLYATRGSLEAKAKEKLKSYGYGFAGTVVP